MSIKVAITAQDKQTISGHAGHCDHFFIFEIDEEGQYQKSSVEVTDADSLHNFLHGDAAQFENHFIKDVKILLTQDIGQGAVQKLARQKIAAYIIREDDPETAIQKLVEGTLEAYANEGGGCGCGSGGGHHEHDHGHHHEHEHAHEHGGGCGCGSGDDHGHDHGNGGCCQNN
ncbi:MAG: hypothetical protein IT220_08790 [Flavobacteriaceae bacterium]|nr:hypothetical protein [Flavobacteriaceae bacterium]